MKTNLRVTHAAARWDDDQRNPGWVVDITTPDGSTTVPPAPSVYHEPETANPWRIVVETAIWEGWQL
jgi:hypothetical protein